jgi:hypothetical protein
MSQRVNAAAPLAGRRPDQGRFAGDTRRTSHIVANPEMAPQPTCTSVNTSLSPSGVLLIKNNIRCSTAASATAMALLARFDPTSPPPTCLEATHQLEKATRPFVKTLPHSNTASPLPVWVHSRLRQFDFDQVDCPLDRQDYAAIGKQAL